MNVRIVRENTDTPLESDALRANLLETAVDEVIVDPSFKVIVDIVREYKGIAGSLDALLYEISHPFRNWNLILPKFRSFSLKNLGHYLAHPQGPEAFERFVAIFLKAVHDAQKNEPLLSFAVDSLLAFLEKTVQVMGPKELPRYEEAMNACFTAINNENEQVLTLIAQGHHPLKAVASHLLQLMRQHDLLEQEGKKKAFDPRPLAILMKRILALNYQYWLREEDPLPWFTAECGELCRDFNTGGLFQAISHGAMEDHRRRLEELDIGAGSALDAMLRMPSHIDIVKLYKTIPDRLVVTEPGAAVRPDGKAIADRFAENRKLLFLFRIMDTAGLSLIHEESLREINRGLVHLIRQQTFEEIQGFLLTTLQLFKANIRKYPHTSLQCIQVIGTEVFRRGNSRLVETFLWEAVRFGFQFASVTGVGEDWQPITNPAHLANIRVWLNLIMQEPKWCSTLFSALIINLKLSGTCVKDTDLFQRDVSKLLNHPIEPVYNLVKQFAKLMPVFFNEIGAEGMLRDVSTEVDEVHKRKDILIHFLRKQSHVESSNLIVDFINAIFHFWRTRDRSFLSPFLPPEVLVQVKDGGPYVDDLHVILERAAGAREISKVEDLLEWEDSRMEVFLAGQKDLAETEIRRFKLLVAMYKLVYQKYNLGFQVIRQQLLQAIDSGFPEMEPLLADLEICETFQCLGALLDQLENLKAVILSPEKYEAKEDIYYKRHIAVDIPSVYGRYREKKFDALSLTFRLENLANIYLEELPNLINLSYITRATFRRVIKCLKLYLRALRIDGITSRRLETYVSLLSSSIGIKRFSYTQYLDIFRGLSEGVKDVIYAYYTNIHENNLSIIIPQIGPKNLLPRYRSPWQESDAASSLHRLSETFMRDLISGTFGLQHLDNFITKIYQTLARQKELLDHASLDLLMTYNPDRAISFLHHARPQTNNLILLGNKGYNLTQLATEAKPVPPGFIITTEVFRCWPVIAEYKKAHRDLMSRIRTALTVIEEKTGRRYGDPAKPLLLSVRSGASISMPGMMATIHNVGMNQELAVEFAKATGNDYLAWDNYRRFLQSWAMPQGMHREEFQTLMNEAKNRHGVSVKRQFAAEQMRDLALAYQRAIREAGIGFPEDPWLQLIGAIEMVLDSWNAKKTRDYRSLMDVSESWGTAVIVQAMVYGNLSVESGSGVVFTAHPYRKVSRVALWGDYAPGDQGEDIVSGLVTTYPVSVEQAEIDGRSKEQTLEVRFPRIYEALLAVSRELVYQQRWNPQEIEFTFEGPQASDLYLLQTRDMITIKKKERFFVFADAPAEETVLGKGIGVSGGALSGRAVFSMDNILELRAEDPDSHFILIRRDTVPEDIKAISLADGLLTARGGQTSHASVVALRLEKTCVVGCMALRVNESEERCEINGHTVRYGDDISIDGRTGLFLLGRHSVKEEVHILPI